ncbi:putative microtubule-binding protein TANGLED [Trema orientale]|uniref:Putative microtubule-binding protein TANGLED n=1 Tax=Trema orientale TaxID=63057 RepID=A0A2P5B578_TREOI|nr:putative microtubule-binding protein TANGLED [Trema orientale]
MVARTPPKQKKMIAALNPVLLRETLQKVDRCMARLQELQYTVSGGTKVISGVSLSPRSTRGYLRTSLRCKQETVRIKNAAPRKSPVGKFPGNSGAKQGSDFTAFSNNLIEAGEWRRMSLPAMLVGETVGEILQASQFAKEIVASVANKTKKITPDDPKTPVSQHRKQRLLHLEEDTELRAKRKKEKQNKSRSTQPESNSPILRRSRSRINFKISPPNKREIEKENNRYVANRVSPRHKPWAKKTVLFPNPLFSSTNSTEQQKFYRTRSPVIARNKQQNSQQHTPHKFLIKSPPSNSKFQVKIRSPPLISRSPTTRAANKSPKMSTASKLRRSFSPSRLATRLVSPLKSRKSSSVHKSDGLITTMNGLKQRPACSIPVGISARRI